MNSTVFEGFLMSIVSSEGTLVKTEDTSDEQGNSFSSISQFFVHSAKMKVSFIVAPAGRPRGLPRRRNIISCTCTSVRVCER